MAAKKKRSARKRAAKTPQQTPRTRRTANGGTLRVGNPGNKGGTGRPPNEFKELCRQLASSAKTIEQVQKILMSPKHPLFMGALKWASEHGYGKPNQSLEIAGDAARPLTIRVVKE
jgi:hypothetical protein